MKLPWFIRQVNGKSMVPILKPGGLLVATKKFKLKKGMVVVAKTGNREIVKRVALVKNSNVFLIGDNTDYSTDSRSLGWISSDQILGKVIWPQVIK